MPVVLLSKSRVCFIGLLLMHSLVYGQIEIANVSVPLARLRQHVFALADDSLQGRKTGTDGQIKAAYYCIKALRLHHLFAAFRRDSIHASFRQTFPFMISEVSPFGGPRMYGSPVFKRQELVLGPLSRKDSSQALYGDNVGGLLIGTDLRKEVIVLSAHYDHLGHSGGQLFHGADDNASGTATVLSVAAVFDSLAQIGIRPRRSILFLLFSGEEGGLLGSDYFVHNSPIPINQLVCNLNMDMVGRVDSYHRKKPDYCYLIADKQSIKLQQMAETANDQSIKLTINQGGYDTKTDPSQFLYRSDQYSFLRRGIPSLFFTSGEHPDYHTPSDTAKRIVYEVLQKRATLVFQTAWLIANEPIR